MVEKRAGQEGGSRAPAVGGAAEGAQRTEKLRVLSDALEQSPSMAVITDTGGEIEYVNAKFTAVTGYTPEEVVGKHVGQLGGRSPEAEKRLWERLASGREWRGEFRNRRKNGGEYWVSACIAPIRSPDGVITHFLGINEDITERKRAEEALRESEAKFRTLAETTDAAVFVVQGAKFRYVSTALEARMGYSRDEFFKMDFWQIVHPDYRELVRERGLARQRGEQVPPQYEIKVLTKNGEERWFDLSVGPVEFEGSAAIIGTAYDITERKQAEEALRESEARNRALLELIPDMLFRVSKDGVYLDFIPGKHAEPLIPPAEFLGKRLQDVLPKRVAEQASHLLGQALQTGEVQTLEHQLKLGDGIRDFEARIIAINEDEGLAIVRDVTERRRAEEALQEAREALESRVENQMRRGVAYGLTFRELTVIHLVAAGKSDKEIGTLLGISPRTANKHVQNILTKMGASSRTEAGVRAVREGFVA